MQFTKTDLLILARFAIQSRLEELPDILDDASLTPELLSPAASFVTLKKQHQLRGCIGTLEAYRPMYLDIMENARAAAFSDPRFPSVTLDEMLQINLDISLLTPPTSIQFNNEEHLLDQLTPTIDGLTIEQNGRRATFLPSVWESLNDKKQFLGHLKQKAGIVTALSGQHDRAWKYQSEIYSEA